MKSVWVVTLDVQFSNPSQVKAETAQIGENGDLAFLNEDTLIRAFSRGTWKEVEYLHDSKD